MRTDWAKARPVVVPTVFVLANAVVFCIVRPGVPDLWAARARASAAGHGVGLTYWFSWFGGSTPASYSVITPSLCAWFGTEFVAAAAAVCLAVLATVLVRRTPRPEAAAYVAAFGVAVNLWSGRVPFLVGSAFAVAALVCVRRRRSAGAAALAMLSVFASPVAGAFLCVGLSGVLVTARMRPYRVPAALAVAGAGGALITLGVVFGVPGPEPFPLYLIGEIVLVLGMLLVLAPPDHLRRTLVLSGIAALALFTIPNGLGANLDRLALFCLPPVAVALSRRRPRLLAALCAPILLLSALSSASAWVSAAKPGASAAYYAPLAGELDSLPHAADYRLELVDSGHAAYAALLGHAVLARGWETQEDRAFNSPLFRGSLDARGYRAWLDDNAVGYIALGLPGGSDAEARLVARAPRGLLRTIWRSAHWRLLQVIHPMPIVGRPATLTASSQSELTVRVPCTCTVSVRVRYSAFLSVGPRLPRGTVDAVADSYQPSLGRDGEGWTTLATNRAGTYVLSGSL